MLSARNGQSSNIFSLSVVVSDPRSQIKPQLTSAYRTGHCFCTPCIASWKNAGGQQCPSCRHVIKNDNGHRIFITIGDLDIPSSDDEPSDGLSAAVVKQAKYVTKRLGRMDATASLKTVQKAEENLLKVADALETDELVEVSSIFLLSIRL